ncbi:MAG: Tim44-like domain-containing protein [Gammaproteobacteria bacterium]|nr:Tim44-like domain-containing protein [Gammaproteobacteria bacterium]
MKNWVIFVVVIGLILAIEPALAAPGGKIARAAFESFWGKIALGALVVFFLPLIIWVLIQEKIAEKRARKDLRFMAAYEASFDWLKLQERVKDCFHRVHSGWRDEDLSGVTEWMTSWYWQNQQMVYLNDWKAKGLVNICNVKKITNIKPLLFVHRNHEEKHEDSLVVISITANMQDYLQERESGKVVEGSKKYKEVETVWSFTMEDGVWKVSDIEEDSMSLSYAKLVRELPRIETTVPARVSS